MVQVLIVDDDVGLRRALRRTVGAAGYGALEAATVAEAVEILGREPVDVALIDLRLGGASGLDLLDHIQQEVPTTRGVLISAHLTADDHEVATELGAVCALGKPLDDESLLGAIDEALEQGTGFPGSVHGLSLLDGLQMFHYAGRVVAIHLAGDPPGLIVMDRGEIVHAVAGVAQGREALAELLRRSSEVVRTTVHVEPFRPTIDEPFDPLLVGVMRSLDEGRAPPVTAGVEVEGCPSTSNPELVDIARTVHSITRRHLEGASVALADVGGPWAKLEGPSPTIEGAELSPRPDDDALVERAGGVPEGWQWIHRVDAREGWALLPIPRGKRTLRVGCPLEAELVAHRFRATMLRMQDEVGGRWPSPPGRAPVVHAEARSGDPGLVHLFGEAGDGVLAVRVVDRERGDVLAKLSRASFSDELWSLVDAVLGEGDGVEVSIGVTEGYAFAVSYAAGARALVSVVPRHFSLGAFRSSLRSRVLRPLERRR